MGVEEATGVVVIGKFLADRLKKPVDDIISLCGGNWLAVKSELQKQNLENTLSKIPNNLKISQNADIIEIFEIMEKASKVSNEQLQQLWSKLLTSYLDEDTHNSYHKSFSNILANLDIVDAKVFTIIKKYEFVQSDTLGGLPVKKINNLKELNNYEKEIQYYNELINIHESLIKLCLSFDNLSKEKLIDLRDFHLLNLLNSPNIFIEKCYDFFAFTHLGNSFYKAVTKKEDK